jgi:type IV secretion system protein VirB8
MTDTTSATANQAQLDPFTSDLLAQARRFDQHAVEQAAAATRRMTILLLVMAALCSISVIAAVYQAMNNREVQPYVLIKDDKTGSVTELVKVEPQQWSHGEAIDAANLGQYVRAREEYSDAQAVFNYEQVELMSTPKVADDYRLWLDPSSNKLSPLALYPNGNVNIDITAVVRVGKGAAQVHFTRSVKGVNNAPRPSSWIAMIEYEYLTKNMTLAARLRNPLGFTVRAYSIDETVPGASRAAPPIALGSTEAQP